MSRAAPAACIAEEIRSGGEHVKTPNSYIHLFRGGFSHGGRAARDAGGIPMSFFVTSEPIEDGGNLGGLEGADAHCQNLATAVGAGDLVWRAYLSTQDRRGAAGSG